MRYPLKRLGEYIDILSGFAFKTKDFVDMGVPIIKIKNITPPFVTLDSLSYVAKEIAEQQKRYELFYDDVLIALTGSHINQMNSVVGRVARVKYYEKTLLNQRVGKITVIDSSLCDLDYVYYYLSQECVKIELAKKAGGAANQANISPTDVKNLVIPFPPVETQKKITDILSAYDDLIENNQKQIKLLEEAAQRLYKEWFVDLRFPGYETTPISGGIPQGWEIKSIMDNDIFLFVKSSVSAFDGEKQYYATADVTETTLISDGETVTFKNKPSRASIQPIINSVWFARMSNTFKILNCYGESSHLAYDSIISSGFAGFTSIDGCYGFVYETIASKKFDDEKNRYATGATQVSLTNEGLKNIQILIPTIEIIKQYSKIVTTYMQKAELLKKNIRLLKQARDRLLPKLMSGEIEV